MALHSGRLPSILGELGRRMGRRLGVLLSCGLRMIIHDPREYIQKCVLAYGAHKPGIAGVVAAILRPGDVFFDVGAKIGHHSLVAASRGALAGNAVNSVNPARGVDPAAQEGGKTG